MSDLRADFGGLGISELIIYIPYEESIGEPVTWASFMRMMDRAVWSLVHWTILCNVTAHISCVFIAPILHLKQISSWF